MEITTLTNNIFSYATGELSQDAFLCWLCSFAREDYAGNDTALKECAREFVKLMYRDEFADNIYVAKIEKQYLHIDVLLTLTNGKRIIIEDKTYSDTHNDQITVYKTDLAKAMDNVEENDYADIKAAEKDIICVFYKIYDQDRPEPKVDVEFTRERVLELFEKYRARISNAIFCDYVEYLADLEHQSKEYEKKSISDWSELQYIGFFKHLLRDEVIKSNYKEVWDKNCSEKDKSYGWDYVNNPSGGFNALWWDYNYIKDFTRVEQPAKVGHCLYLQLQDNQIVVKLELLDTKEAQELYDVDMVYRFKQEVFVFFEKMLKNQDVECFRWRFRHSRYSSILSIEYDEKNYKYRLKLMEELLAKAREELIFK